MLGWVKLVEDVVYHLFFFVLVVEIFFVDVCFLGFGFGLKFRMSIVVSVMSKIQLIGEIWGM